MTYQDSSPASGGSRARPEHPLIPADRVNGTDVYNKAGEKVGKVEDVAIEKVSGKVAYAIMSFGGFLGIAERYHPVPWSLLRYDVDKRGYVIPCDREALENAPSFDSEALSGWDDGEARDAIFAYYMRYGVNPYWI
jgi:sporulation protein YlmC with PRC-barrel domain